MSIQDCIFCRIIDGQIPAAKVFENQNVLAFLDIGPVSKGHTLVIHKQHTSSVARTDPQILKDIAEVLPVLTSAVQKAMNADGCNILCNNGAAAGQVVDHLHFHIIPRKINDGVFNRWISFEYEDGIINELKQKITTEIRRNISETTQ